MFCCSRRVHRWCIGVISVRDAFESLICQAQNWIISWRRPLNLKTLLALFAENLKGRKWNFFFCFYYIFFMFPFHDATLTLPPHPTRCSFVRDMKKHICARENKSEVRNVQSYMMKNDSSAGSFPSIESLHSGKRVCESHCGRFFRCCCSMTNPLLSEWRWHPAERAVERSMETRWIIVQEQKCLSEKYSLLCSN